MRPHPALSALALLLANLCSLTARETLVVPAVSIELTYGGEGKVTVDGKVTKLTGEAVAALRAKLAPLHTETLSLDLTRLQELEAAAARATGEAASRARAVEREGDRVADQQRQIATLEKRQKEVRDELNEAVDRNYNVNLDNLRAKLNAIGSSLASERKELERARERLAVAEKRKAENDAALNEATARAATLRKELTERVGQVRAALKAAGVAVEPKG